MILSAELIPLALRLSLGSGRGSTADGCSVVFCRGSTPAMVWVRDRFNLLRRICRPRRPASLVTKVIHLVVAEIFLPFDRPCTNSPARRVLVYQCG
jgi:hypothetical protein